MQNVLPARLALAAAALLIVAPVTSAAVSNALDRINFGDVSPGPYSEQTHSFVDLGSPTGTGALGLTYRQIAPSLISSQIGNAAYNRALTFTLKCDPALQNYLTIKLWGSETTNSVIYLYNPSQGYSIANYYGEGHDQPELDFQEATTSTGNPSPVPDAPFPGRFYYATVPIAISWTTGKNSVTLTLNAAESYYYYNQTTTNLAAGQTSKAIYSAFSHTDPFFIPDPGDATGRAPSPARPTATQFTSDYFDSLISEFQATLTTVEGFQLYGSTWTANMAQYNIPPQVLGAFDSSVHPSSYNTAAAWLNNVAVKQAGGNNVNMRKLEMLAIAFNSPDLGSNFYQNEDVEARVIAGLDFFSYLQSLNGCFGNLTQWPGIGATAPTSSSPQGRINAPCNSIEGAGTESIGLAFQLMENDPGFLTALDQPVNATLEPGVLRWQAYQQMFLAHCNFLNAPNNEWRGHAPNQDMFQATAFTLANNALLFLDSRYHTHVAFDQSVALHYIYQAVGLATEQYGGVWVSNKGLSLEVNGTGNGGYDGGYGENGVHEIVRIAKFLRDAGVEYPGNQPVYDMAIRAIHAFSNFISPSVTGPNNTATFRKEEVITFRKNLAVGEIDFGGYYTYYAGAEFQDPVAIHLFYQEAQNGLTWSDLPPTSNGHFDDIFTDYLEEFEDYKALANLYNAHPDETGVQLLNEKDHPDGQFLDPEGGAVAIKHDCDRVFIEMNWRPLHGSAKPNPADEIVNNIARIHFTTGAIDRVATIAMPADAATGASGSYVSGPFGTQYITRYGRYLVALNWLETTGTLTLPPDMNTGIAIDLVSGVRYDLRHTTSVPVPPQGGVVLYQESTSNDHTMWNFEESGR